MGKCEAATTTIGIKILLSDLIFQINEKNIELIKEILERGFISDENEFDNDEYKYILSSEDQPENHLDYKKFLEKEFSENDFLIEKELLLPIKPILETCRWGNDRCGKNGNSRPIDFDLSVDLEKYKEIEKYTIVFILEQSSG